MLTGNTRTEVSDEKLPTQIISEQAEYLSWYDGPVAFVTKENKDEVIVMTGEELLYRNEVYGFQVKLGKAWKGVRISDIKGNSTEKKNYPSLKFEMPSPFRKNTFEVIIKIIMLNDEEYHQEREEKKNHVFETLEEFDHTILWNNNKYYFSFSWSNRLHEEMYEIFYPHLECKDIFKDWFIIKSCEEGLIDLFSDWEVFDIQ